jgi:hypothetical protein
MKKIYMVAVLLSTLISTEIFGQKFDWAQRGGHYAYDYGYGVATDAAGNVFVAGKYEETGAVFGSFTLPCAGNHDIFVAKYNSAGVIQWIRTAGGPGGDYAHAICIDQAGNVIIAGEIENNGDFGTTHVVASSADNDMFIAKYSNNGDLIYVKLAGGATNDKAYGVCADKSGNAYITGHVEGYAKFGAYSVTSAGVKDIIVAKYDPAGVEQWVVRAGGANTDIGKGISINAANELYVNGFYRGSASFTGSTTVLNSKTAAYDDAFIARYDMTNGALIWAKTAGGDYDDDGWALTTAANGKIFMSGEFNAYANFDATHALTTSGNADAFVACYDNTGAVQWVVSGGGPLIDRARGICADASSNVFITGQYGAKGVFGTTTLSAPDSSDIFVASYDATGAFRWALSAAGPQDPLETLGFESGLAVAVDIGNAVYVSGSYLGVTSFGATTLDPYTRTDVFVTRVSQTGTNPIASGINEIKSLESLDVYPNPNNGKFTVSFNLTEKDNYNLELTNLVGQVVYSEKLSSFEGTYSKTIEIGNYSKGLYTIKLSNSQNQQFRKIVVY